MKVLQETSLVRDKVAIISNNKPNSLINYKSIKVVYVLNKELTNKKIKDTDVIS